MNRWLVLAVVVLSIIGLIINSAVDVDNVYDTMLVGLWALTFIVSILGLLLGGGWNARSPIREKVTNGTQANIATTVSGNNNPAQES